ncbi:hypothetical protein ACO0LL_11380 [Undibacterium sp. TC4M20W]|uniref:hypothetical protein n=1 Tax=Undibacterium sp. TC4M20W TaxID=3413052 RepID=UPI003BF1BD76
MENMQGKQRLSLERKLIICLGIVGFVIGLLAEHPAETHLSVVTAQSLRISCSALGFTSFAAAVIPKSKTSHVLTLFVATVVLYLVLVFS